MSRPCQKPFLLLFFLLTSGVLWLQPLTAHAQTRVDIMVLYTEQARSAAGGTAGIVSRIDSAIAQANQSFAASDARVFLNLVHTGELAFTESSNMVSMLESLQKNTTAQTLRDRYGADLVALLTGGTNTGGIAGIAYLLAPPESSFAPWAYSVTRQDQALFHVFAHEVGHNMGCQHDPGNASTQGAYSYSYGHRFYASGIQYRTVMSYAPGTRISYFSNPNVSMGGVATGTSTRDNARSLRNTRSLVSAFREEVSTFWFRAVALDNRVMLRWARPTDSGYPTDNVLVRGSTTEYPSTTADGVQIYTGTDRSYLHTDLSSGVPRYYTIWTHDGNDWVAP